MALTNAWGMGHIASMTQFRPSKSCSDALLSSKRSSNLKLGFFFGWGLGCSVYHKPADFRPRKSPNLCCRCSNNPTIANNGNSSSSFGWDWNQWSRHFSEIEQAESFASVLKVPFLFISRLSLFVNHWFCEAASWLRVPNCWIRWSLVSIWGLYIVS